MATPSKSVQCRDVSSIVEMYKSMEIPAYGIKQNSALNYKYNGDNLDEGAAKLEGFLTKIEECESCAIYTICLYEDPQKGINERTPVDLSFNFRLLDQPLQYGNGERFNGGYGQLLGEISGLKKQLAALQQQPAEEGKLGVIGELLEYEALQPVWMAIGTRIADLVMPGQPKLGELKRVSGIPGIQSDISREPVSDWHQDKRITDALDRLSIRVPDLGTILQKLADMAEERPGKFNIYLAMLRKMS